MSDQCKTCEGDVLIVEVPGTDHPDGHHIRLFDTEDMEQQEWLEDQVELEETDTEVLHVWNWQGQPNRNLWLEIDADEGDPIRLPFLRNANAVPRQADIQDHEYHVLMPVVPMTFLSGVTREQDNPAHPVVSRPGFLYVFYRGELWRELAVRQDDDGRTTYHDVRLSDYRNAENEFRNTEREVSGVALDEIWLPARLDNQWQTLEVAFSESQLPAPRLNRLESDDALRRQRCTEVNMEWQQQRFGQPIDEVNKASRAFPLSSTAPQRPRDPGYETQFDQPIDYLHDLSGDHPEQALETAREIQERHDDHKPNYRVHEDERPEMDAWGLVLQETLDTQHSDHDDFEASAWEAQGTVEDVLEAARERGIGGIVIADPIFRVRHLQQRHATARRLMEMAQLYAQAHEHHNSAVLVQSLVAPDNLDGDENPLHEHYEELSESGKAEAEKATAWAERQLIRTYLGRIQEDMLGLLTNLSAQEALADLFCFDGWDYLGAFQLTNSLCQAILQSPEEIDPLYTGQHLVSPYSPGRQWLHEGFPNSKLAYMLLPEADEAALRQPYQPPEDPLPNNGDGRFRPTELARLEDQDEPEEDSLRTLDGAHVAALSESGAYLTLLTSAFRYAVQAIMQIHGELFSALESATQAWHNSRAEVRTLNQEQRSVNRQLQEVKDEYARFRQQRREGLDRGRAAMEELEQRKASLERTQQQLARRWQSLNEQLIAARMRLYGPMLEQLRASTPGTMGGMWLERLSNARQNNYFVFAFDSLPANQPNAVRMFGNIWDASGEAVATTNQSRAARFEIPDGPAREALVWVLPSNHQTARLIREIATAENQLVLTHKAQANARTNLSQARRSVQAANRELRQVAERISRVKDRSAQILVSADTAREAANEASNQRLRAVNNRWYNMLQTPALPAVVLMVEGFNVISVTGNSSQMKEQRGLGRAGLGFVSAYYDLALASMLLTERFSQNELGRRAGQLMGRIEHAGFQRTVQGLGFKYMTVRALGGAAGGLAMAGISFWDAHHAFRMGNSAAWGHISVGAGGVAMGMASVAGLAVKGVLLGLGPAGWLALGVAATVGGLALIWWLNDEPMETWLRHGPFGELNEVPPLKDPDEAFYRLAGLLAAVRIEITPNPFRAEARDGVLDDLEEAELTVLKEATDVIRVTSPVTNYFSHTAVSTAELAWHLRLQRQDSELSTTPFSIMPSQKTDIQVVDNETFEQAVLEDREIPNGHEIFVQTPRAQSESNRRWWGAHSQRSSIYRWQVRAQARVELDEHHYLFPAPPPEDQGRRILDEDNAVSQHTSHDFSQTDRRYWADERTHRVRND